MNFDIRHVPFSRFGSYLAFSLMDGPSFKSNGLTAGLWLRCLHGDAAHEVFRLEVLSGGRPVKFQARATPAELVLEAGRGRVRVCIAEKDLVRLRGEGVGLRLTLRPGGFNCAVPAGEGRWHVNAASAFRNYMLVPLRGRLGVDAPWEVARCKHVVADWLPDAAGGVWEGAVEQFVAAWTRRRHTGSFERCVREAGKDFQSFRRKYPSVPRTMARTAELAAYVNWASVVAPCRGFTRAAMLMSKNWMTNVWSWDHCFNALALSYGNPELAWDQYMLMFDRQHASGQLPDFINDVVALMNFVKPPVHGWTLGRMLENNRWFADPSRLKEAYGPLCRLTEWWFTHRNDDGLLVYHHGNDSGWDNGTVFDVGFPVKAADLAAFAIVQMDVLADVAGRLGKHSHARRWRRRADAALAGLMGGLWRGDRFVCTRAADGAVAEKSDSVFNCLPIVLGRRLPPEVRGQLARTIRRHLTAYGPATENVSSPLYSDDGYWRGPIWAPPTLILADGLRRAGETALARQVARRFCNLVRKSGMAENFNARTGAPLRDRAYTWTSSTFLVLAHEYLQHSPKGCD